MRCHRQYPRITSQPSKPPISPNERLCAITCLVCWSIRPHNPRGERKLVGVRCKTSAPIKTPRFPTHQKGNYGSSDNTRKCLDCLVLSLVYRRHLFARIPSSSLSHIRQHPPNNADMLEAFTKRLNGSKTNGAVSGDNQSEPILEGNFPASWYTEPLFYDFERRGIFSKHWLLTTHRLRLPDVGSYLRFELANFDFILVKNKEGNIQAFHNVCRHRAYPIIDKDTADAGTRRMLSCGYHGTSCISKALTLGLT